MEAKLLTTTEAAQVLRCSKRYVYTLLGEESFPKVQIGRKYLIPEDELEKWVRSRYTAQNAGKGKGEKRMKQDRKSLPESSRRPVL